MPHTVDVVIERRGFSLEQLTNATGLSAERIESIVNGRWTPSPDERVKIADALGVAVEEISWGHTMNPRNVRYHRYGLPETLSDSND